MIRIVIIVWPCIHHGGAERWWYHVLDELGRGTKISYYVVIPLSLHRGCLRCLEAIRSTSIITIYLMPKRNLLLDIVSQFKSLIELIRKKNIDLIVAGYQTPRIVLVALLASVITKRRAFTYNDSLKIRYSLLNLPQYERDIIGCLLVWRRSLGRCSNLMESKIMLRYSAMLMGQRSLSFLQEARR